MKLSLTARAGFAGCLRITHHSKWVQLQNLISGIIQSGGERETGIVNTKWKYSRTCINSLCVAVPFPPPPKVK